MNLCILGIFSNESIDSIPCWKVKFNIQACCSALMRSKFMLVSSTLDGRILQFFRTHLRLNFLQCEKIQWRVEVTFPHRTVTFPWRPNSQKFMILAPISFVFSEIMASPNLNPAVTCCALELTPTRWSSQNDEVVVNKIAYLMIRWSMKPR